MANDIGYRVEFSMGGVLFSPELDKKRALKLTGELERLKLHYRIEKGHYEYGVLSGTRGNRLSRADLARERCQFSE